MISNLLDNAREAGAKNIGIEYQTKNSVENLIFSDDGKPIPAVVIENLGQRGNTHDKLGGTGLGLFQSLKFMRSIGGDLKLSQQSSEKVILLLPRTI